MANGITTKERLIVIEEKLKQNNIDHKSIIEKFIALDRKLDKWMAGSDKKYASKLTERIVYTSIAVIALWVLNQILHIIEY